MLWSHKLPFQFNAERLKADLTHVLCDEWVPHFNRGYYEGAWKGVALRASTGRTNQMYRPPDDMRAGIDTAVIARCPYFHEVLTSFECPILFARLLSLGPNSKIREHSDYFIGLEDGMIRLHIPIVTDPRVEFFVDNQRLVMMEGEAWYIDFTLPHRVNNFSVQDRVHLVIDCTVNDWLHSIIPFGDEALCETPILD